MRILSIVNQKGGTGKSTVGCQLAFFIASLGRRVAMMDLDEQSNTSYTFRAMDNGFTSSQFLHEAPVQVNSAEETPFGKIHLYKADRQDLQAVERSMEDATLVKNLTARMAELEAHYDWVLLDTPGSNSKVANATLFIADYVLTPCPIDSYALPVASRIYERVKKVKHHFNPKLNMLGLLPNLFKANDAEMVRHLKELLAYRKDSVLMAKIGDRSAIRKACDDGVPIWKMQKTAAREAAKEVRNAFSVIEKKIEGGF